MWGCLSGGAGTWQGRKLRALSTRRRISQRASRIILPLPLPPLHLHKDPLPLHHPPQLLPVSLLVVPGRVFLWSHPPASQPGPVRARRNIREPAPYTPRATRAQRRQQAVAAAAEAVEEGPGAPEDDECNVCFVAKLNLRRPVIIVPCGHAKTCEACVDNLKNMNSHCPLCRTKIRSKTIAIL